MSKFFIRRPIVAIVIAILTVIIGAGVDADAAHLAVSRHCSARNPGQATYPGADAQDRLRRPFPRRSSSR